MAEIKKKKVSFPIVPVVLFVIVLLSTIWLYVYNTILTWEIEEENGELTKVETSIKELKKDKTLQVVSLIEANKRILTKMEENSNITKYIDHLANVWRRYSISFKWFNMSNWKITTKATSKNKTTRILAYMNVKNFIEKYRKEDSALFELDFINSFEWSDKMTFPVSFTIKGKSKK